MSYFFTSGFNLIYNYLLLYYTHKNIKKNHRYEKIK